MFERHLRSLFIRICLHSQRTSMCNWGNCQDPASASPHSSVHSCTVSCWLWPARSYFHTWLACDELACDDELNDGSEVLIRALFFTSLTNKLARRTIPAGTAQAEDRTTASRRCIHAIDRWSAERASLPLYTSFLFVLSSTSFPERSAMSFAMVSVEASPE